MKRDLELAAFIAGAAVMIVELVGSRLVAPFLGSSLIVWTTLIGVILGCLSLGYALGGRLADRRADYRILGWLIVIAAVLIIALAWFHAGIGPVAAGLMRTFGIELAVFFVSIALFGLPSVFLGMVPPYVIKLRLRELETTGRIAGNLYALSTLGSIAGTFAAGLWLIPTFGSFRSLIGVSLGLLLLALLFIGKRARPLLMLLALLVSGSFASAGSLNLGTTSALAEYESGYGRFFLVPQTDADSGRPTLHLMTSPHLSQSARFLDRDDDLVFEYTRFFRLIGAFAPDLESTLLIGGGAYSFPKDHLSQFPEAAIDVVEIDPLVTAIAREHFNLPEDSRLRTIHEDGRIFLNENETMYDAVIIDAFGPGGSVPFQLATVEAVRLVHDAVRPGGVVIVNMIGRRNGPTAKFINSEYATYAEVFEEVRLYPLGDDPDELQNIMLVALKDGAWPAEFPEPYAPPAAPILTDDWAPVDYFLSGIL